MLAHGEVGDDELPECLTTALSAEELAETPMPDRKTLPPPPTAAPTDADFAGNPLAC